MLQNTKSIKRKPYTTNLKFISQTNLPGILYTRLTVVTLVPHVFLVVIDMGTLPKDL